MTDTIYSNANNSGGYGSGISGQQNPITVSTPATARIASTATATATYSPPETPVTPPRQSTGNRNSNPPWYAGGSRFPWFGRNGRRPGIFGGVGNPQGIISQQQALTGNLVYAVLAGQVNGTMPATIGNILNLSAATISGAGTGSKFYNKW